jgi:steroid 5-alpha reductase family enzyme
MMAKKRSSISKPLSLFYCTCAYLTAGGTAFIFTLLGDFESPLAAAAVADFAATVTVFLFSRMVDNTSIYDPYWSVAPLPIALFWFAEAGGRPTPHCLLILVLIAVWSARLTWNWVRRWPGIGHEDWRYADFRSRSGSYWIVSLFGFHLMPSVIVFIALIPVYRALSSSVRFKAFDLIGAFVAVSAILIETVADRQLSVFRQRAVSGGEFLESGLWRYSRHPNYFGEVLFWWGLYLFVIPGSTEEVLTIAGPISMTLLFWFVSIPMMEARLKRRIPQYTERVGRRPKLIPRPYRQSG